MPLETASRGHGSADTPTRLQWLEMIALAKASEEVNRKLSTKSCRLRSYKFCETPSPETHATPLSERPLFSCGSLCLKVVRRLFNNNSLEVVHAKSNESDKEVKKKYFFSSDSSDSKTDNKNDSKDKNANKKGKDSKGKDAKGVDGITKDIQTFFDSWRGCYNCGRMQFGSAIAYLKKDENRMQRYAAITAGGLLGFLAAYKKGKVKKVVYAATGAGVVYAVIFPAEACAYIEATTDKVKNLFFYAYDCIKKEPCEQEPQKGENDKGKNGKIYGGKSDEEDPCPVQPYRPPPPPPPPSPPRQAPVQKPAPDKRCPVHGSCAPCFPNSKSLKPDPKIKENQKNCVCPVHPKPCPPSQPSQSYAPNKHSPGFDPNQNPAFYPPPFYPPPGLNPYGPNGTAPTPGSSPYSPGGLPPYNPYPPPGSNPYSPGGSPPSYPYPPPGFNPYSPGTPPQLPTKPPCDDSLPSQSPPANSDPCSSGQQSPPPSKSSTPSTDIPSGTYSSCSNGSPPNRDYTSPIPHTQAPSLPFSHLPGCPAGGPKPPPPSFAC